MSASTTFTGCLIVFFVIATFVCGSPAPHGSRSASESKALHEDRRNTLHKKIPNVVDLKAEFFDNYIKPHHWKEQRARYWLVLFYSSWCLTCQDYEQPLREAASKVHERWEHEHTIVYKQKELPRGQLSIGKHDTTYGDVVALKYKVEGYPTLMLFDRDDDKKTTTFEGIPSTEAILTFIRENTDVKV
jgi:thiol-disulfide isomerase/thioredoxin